MMYNILFFLRNNAIAVSGTKGIAVDFSKIPTFLDEEDETNRLLKFMAYVKQGFAALDTSKVKLDNLCQMLYLIHMT